MRLAGIIMSAVAVLVVSATAAAANNSANVNAPIRWSDDKLYIRHTVTYDFDFAQELKVRGWLRGYVRGQWRTLDYGRWVRTLSPGRGTRYAFTLRMDQARAYKLACQGRLFTYNRIYLGDRVRQAKARVPC